VYPQPGSPALKKALAAGLTAALAFLLVEFFSLFGAFDIVENAMRDIRLANRGQQSPPAEILLVNFPDWPVPRSEIAEVVSALAGGAAKTIALDILLDYPTSEEDDRALESAIAEAGNVILGQELLFGEGPAPAAIPPLERFASNAWGVGFTNLVRDPYDKVVREAQLVAGARGEYASLAALAAAHARGASSPSTVYRGAASVTIADAKIPTSPSHRITIGYFGGRDVYDPETGESYVYTSEIVRNMREMGMLLPDISPFTGKVVLLGSLSQHTRDLHKTPFDEAAGEAAQATPGLIIQANITGNLLFPSRIIRDARQFQMLFAALFAFGFAIIFFSLDVKASIALGAVATAAAISAQYFAFPSVSLSLVAPTATLPLVFIGSLYWHWLAVARNREHVRNIFGYYVSRDLAKNILEDPSLIRMGGERIECTFLFCDINKFSTISEALEPEEVVGMLNLFFTEMHEAVQAYGGWLNKYLGDGLLAVFGALQKEEKHANRAVLSAVDMRFRMERVRDAVRARYGVENFGATIGVHTGPASVGNIGSPQRMEYTVIGDAVNVCQRIVEEAKRQGVAVVVTQETKADLDGIAELSEIGSFTVRGRSQPVVIYRVGELSGAGSRARAMNGRADKELGI
jgi:adenylate cyclase